MKGHEFKLLTATIESLKASTSVTFVCGGIAADIDGRCSPYISHQTVDFREDADSRNCGILHIANFKRRLTLAYGEFTPESAPEGCEMCNVRVPVDLVQDLIGEADRTLGSQFRVPGEKLVWAAFPVKRVARWDGARPVFEGEPEKVTFDAPHTDDTQYLTEESKALMDERIPELPILSMPVLAG